MEKEQSRMEQIIEMLAKASEKNEEVKANYEPTDFDYFNEKMEGRSISAMTSKGVVRYSDFEIKYGFLTMCATNREKEIVVTAETRLPQYLVKVDSLSMDDKSIVEAANELKSNELFNKPLHANIPAMDGITREQITSLVSAVFQEISLEHNYKYEQYQRSEKEEDERVDRLLDEYLSPDNIAAMYEAQYERALENEFYRTARALIDGKTVSDLESIDIEHQVDGESLMHVMARMTKPEAMKALVAAGADVNSQDENGYTPLHILAAQGTKGDFDACEEVLAKAGADYSIRTNVGASVADVAHKEGHPKVNKEALDKLKKKVEEADEKKAQVSQNLSKSLKA